MYKGSHSFRMTIMEERSLRLEAVQKFWRMILKSTHNWFYNQVIQNYKVSILGDLHPLGKSGLDMYDLF